MEETAYTREDVVVIESTVKNQKPTNEMIQPMLATAKTKKEDAVIESIVKNQKPTNEKIQHAAEIDEPKDAVNNITESIENITVGKEETTQKTVKKYEALKTKIASMK
jgi:hypothetical protein